MKECQYRLKRIIKEFEVCHDALVAIGDETRQLIIMTLLESDCNGIRVGEITEKTHLSRPAVSHHLKILKDAGLVNVRREGTSNYYYLTIADSTKELRRLGTYLQELLSSAKERPSPMNAGNL